jgi:hypothetical protein
MEDRPRARGRERPGCAALGRLAATAADGGDQQIFGAKQLTSAVPGLSETARRRRRRHVRDLKEEKVLPGERKTKISARRFKTSSGTAAFDRAPAGFFVPCPFIRSCSLSSRFPEGLPAALLSSLALAGQGEHQNGGISGLFCQWRTNVSLVFSIRRMLLESSAAAPSKETRIAQAPVAERPVALPPARRWSCKCGSRYSP